MESVCNVLIFLEEKKLFTIAPDHRFDLLWLLWIFIKASQGCTEKWKLCLCTVYLNRWVPVPFLWENALITSLTKKLVSLPLLCRWCRFLFFIHWHLKLLGRYHARGRHLVCNQCAPAVSPAEHGTVSDAGGGLYVLFLDGFATGPYPQVTHLSSWSFRRS